MKNIVNIAVVGLGQVGIYLLNELNTKKKDIELKTGKKINIVAISAKNINKKRKFKFNKKIFFKNPLEIFAKKKVDILFEAIGQSDGMSKKIKIDQKKMSEILKKSDDITTMSIEEYDIYIDDYIKKSKYPNISE